MTRTLVPNGDGYYTEVVGGGPFYTKVDDDPGDGVAYINMAPSALGFAKYSATLSDYDLLYGNQRPNKVTVRVRCRQNLNTGYRAKAFLRIAGFDYIHVTELTPTEAFSNLTWEWDQNPYTVEEWEDADLDSLEIGIQIENTASEVSGVDIDNIVCDFEEENAGPGTWSTIVWSWSSQKIGTVSHFPIRPGTVTITTDELTPQVLTDTSTSDGTLAGDGEGLIDYTTGQFSVEFTDVPPPGTKLYANYVAMEGYCGHCKTNAVRLRFVPGPPPWGITNYSEIDQAEAFKKLVSKLYKVIPANVIWLPIAQEITIKAHFGHRFDAIEADTLFWRRKEPLGIGNGSDKLFTNTSKFTAISPSSVIITAVATDSSTMTVTDDGNGNLIGDVDGGGTNTVDYETGDINLTFSLAVKNSERVFAEYRFSAADNGYHAEMTVTTT
jgi:hypothetical protein